MKRLFQIALVAAGAGLFSSCYYDPYSSGYGYADSYGYSGGGTAFIHTSSDNWFYDSKVRCYYDRSRSAYYDPWLGGYYPSGYCPQPVYHVPHPYGWSGHGTCPPPRNVRYNQIDRYKDRIALLKARNYQWAEKVRLNQAVASANWQNARARAASNFQVAKANQQIRNQQLRNAYSRANRGNNYQGQTVAPGRFSPQVTQPKPPQNYNQRTRQNYNPPQNNNVQRSGYNKPVNSAVQAQKQRNEQLRNAMSNARQQQAQAYQKQKEALQNWNQKRKNR
ncbi:hypothetical protein HAHE_31120 [Haloferula helveola]|uniref:Lipoprotein n=1 Tax=Haloferula helveola TaxID=490095 RepID=A0ABM7RH72_9BACT|nr:hypothetical protein HAHE_31120 [Haloferula helveola]